MNLTSKHYLEKNESGIHVSVDLDDENLNTRQVRLENITLMVWFFLDNFYVTSWWKFCFTSPTKDKSHPLWYHISIITCAYNNFAGQCESVSVKLVATDTSGTETMILKQTLVKRPLLWQLCYLESIILSQLAFTCSKSTMQTPERFVKHVQSL